MWQGLPRKHVATTNAAFIAAKPITTICRLDIREEGGREISPKKEKMRQSVDASVRSRCGLAGVAKKKKGIWLTQASGRKECGVKLQAAQKNPAYNCKISRRVTMDAGGGCLKKS